MFAGLIKSKSVLEMVSNPKIWDIEVPEIPVQMITKLKMDKTGRSPSKKVVNLKWMQEF